MANGVKEGRTTADARSGLDRGWAWVVLAATFGSFVIVGGTLQTVGLIHTILLDRYDDGIAKTALVGVLFTSLASLAGPLSSYISDRTSCRTSMLVAGTLFMTGYLATAFSPNISVCIFTCGIVAGMGSGICYTTVFVITGFYFRKKLVLAVALASTGTGFGMFCLSPLIELAKEHYGSTGAFLLLSGVSMHLLVFGMLMRPSPLEIKIQNTRKTQLQGKSRDVGILKEYLAVCLEKPMLFMCSALFLYCGGQYTIFLYFPAYCIDEGSSDFQSALILSVCGILNIVGRLMAAIISRLQCVKSMFLFSGSMIVFGLAAVFFPLYAAYYAGQMIFSVLLGTCFGFPYVVLLSINKQYVGDRHTAAAVGIEYFFAGIGSIIGPLSAGYILDSGGHYGAVFIICGSCIIIASVLGILSCFVKGNTKMNENTEVTFPEVGKILFSQNDTQRTDVEQDLIKGESHENC